MKRGQKLTTRQRRKLRAAGARRVLEYPACLHHLHVPKGELLFRIARQVLGVKPRPGEGWRRMRSRLRLERGAFLSVRGPSGGGVVRP